MSTLFRIDGISRRFPIITRIISALLVISFLAYDITWANPDISAGPKSDKLAPDSFFKQKNSKDRVIAEAISVIEQNAFDVIPKENLTLRALYQGFKNRSEWANNITVTETAGGEIIEFFINLLPGYTVRYYNPTHPNQDDFKGYGNAPLNIDQDEREINENIHKEILKTYSLPAHQGKPLPESEKRKDSPSMVASQPRETEGGFQIFDAVSEIKPSASRIHINENEFCPIEPGKEYEMTNSTCAVLMPFDAKGKPAGVFHIATGNYHLRNGFFKGLHTLLPENRFLIITGPSDIAGYEDQYITNLRAFLKERGISEGNICVRGINRKFQENESPTLTVLVRTDGSVQADYYVSTADRTELAGSDLIRCIEAPLPFTAKDVVMMALEDINNPRPRASFKEFLKETAAAPAPSGAATERYIVAFKGGKAIAYCAYNIIERIKQAVLKRIVVAKEAEGRDVERLIFDETLRRVKRLGAESCAVHVEESGPSQRFHDSMVTEMSPTGTVIKVNYTGDGKIFGYHLDLGKYGAAETPSMTAADGPIGVPSGTEPSAEAKERIRNWRRYRARYYGLDRLVGPLKAIDSIFTEIIDEKNLPSARILDVATGPGTIACAALKHGATDVVAMDINRGFVRAAGKRMAAVKAHMELKNPQAVIKTKCLRGDMYDVDGSLERGRVDGKFDYIIIGNVLCFYKDEADRLKILESVKTRLKEGGMLIILGRTYDEIHEDARYNAVEQIGTFEEIMGPYRGILEKAGFGDIKITRLNTETDEDWGTELRELEVIVNENVAITATLPPKSETPSMTASPNIVPVGDIERFGFRFEGEDTLEVQQANVTAVFKWLLDKDPTLDTSKGRIFNIGSGDRPLLTPGLPGKWRYPINVDLNDWAEKAARNIGAAFYRADIRDIANLAVGASAEAIICYRMGAFINVYQGRRTEDFWRPVWKFVKPGGYLILINPPHPELHLSQPSEMRQELVRDIAPEVPGEEWLISCYRDYEGGTTANALIIRKSKPETPSMTAKTARLNEDNTMTVEVHNNAGYGDHVNNLRRSGIPTGKSIVISYELASEFRKTRERLKDETSCHVEQSENGDISIERLRTLMPGGLAPNVIMTGNLCVNCLASNLRSLVSYQMDTASGGRSVSYHFIGDKIAVTMIPILKTATESFAAISRPEAAPHYHIPLTHKVTPVVFKDGERVLGKSDKGDLKSKVELYYWTTTAAFNKWVQAPARPPSMTASERVYTIEAKPISGQEARRIGAEIEGLAREQGFVSRDAEKLGELTIELVANISEFGNGGRFTSRVVKESDKTYIELIGEDRGKGIEDVQKVCEESSGRVPSTGWGFWRFARSPDEAIVESFGKCWEKNGWNGFDLKSEPGSVKAGDGTRVTLRVYKRGRNGNVIAGKPAAQEAGPPSMTAKDGELGFTRREFITGLGLGMAGIAGVLAIRMGAKKIASIVRPSLESEGDKDVDDLVKVSDRGIAHKVVIELGRLVYEMDKEAVGQIFIYHLKDKEYWKRLNMNDADAARAAEFYKAHTRGFDDESNSTIVFPEILERITRRFVSRGKPVIAAGRRYAMLGEGRRAVDGKPVAVIYAEPQSFLIGSGMYGFCDEGIAYVDRSEVGYLIDEYIVPAYRSDDADIPVCDNWRHSNIVMKRMRPAAGEILRKLAADKDFTSSAPAELKTKRSRLAWAIEEDIARHEVEHLVSQEGIPASGRPQVKLLIKDFLKHPDEAEKPVQDEMPEDTELIDSVMRELESRFVDLTGDRPQIALIKMLDHLIVSDREPVRNITILLILEKLTGAKALEWAGRHRKGFTEGEERDAMLASMAAYLEKLSKMSAKDAADRIREDARTIRETLGIPGGQAAAAAAAAADVPSMKAAAVTINASTGEDGTVRVMINGRLLEAILDEMRSLGYGWTEEVSAEAGTYETIITKDERPTGGTILITRRHRINRQKPDILVLSKTEPQLPAGSYYGTALLIHALTKENRWAGLEFYTYTESPSALKMYENMSGIFGIRKTPYGKGSTFIEGMVPGMRFKIQAAAPGGVVSSIRNFAKWVISAARRYIQPLPEVGTILKRARQRLAAKRAPSRRALEKTRDILLIVIDDCTEAIQRLEAKKPLTVFKAIALWAYRKKLKEAEALIQEVNIATRKTVVIQKDTYEHRNRHDVETLFTRRGVLDILGLKLAKGRHIVLDIGVGAFPFTTCSLAKGLKTLNPHITVIGTELPSACAEAHITSKALVERFRRDVAEVLNEARGMGISPEDVTDIRLVVDRNNEVIEALAGMGKPESNDYVTLAVAPHISYEDAKGNTEIDLFRQTALFEHMLLFLGKNRIKGLLTAADRAKKDIYQEGDSSTPDITILRRPVRRMFRDRKVGVRYAITDIGEKVPDPEKPGGFKVINKLLKIRDVKKHGVSLITLNNVMLHWNQAHKDMFMNEIAPEVLKKGGMVQIKNGTEIEIYRLESGRLVKHQEFSDLINSRRSIVKFIFDRLVEEKYPHVAVVKISHLADEDRIVELIYSLDIPEENFFREVERIYAKAIADYKTAQATQLPTTKSANAAKRQDPAVSQPPSMKAETAMQETAIEELFGDSVERLIALGLPREKLVNAVNEKILSLSSTQVIGFQTTDEAVRQTQLVRTEIRRIIEERLSEGGHEFNIYAIGAGIRPFEIYETIEIFYDELAKLAGAGKTKSWKLNIMVFESRTDIITAANYELAQKAAEHKSQNGWDISISVDCLDVAVRHQLKVCLDLAQEERGRLTPKADLILHRYVSYANMYPKHISSPATYPDEAIGSYLQLKNLITLLGRPGAAYVCEPAISFGEDTSATGIRIPGLEEVRLGEHRGSGVYRIRDSEAIGKTSLIAFSKMNAEPEPPSMKAAEMDAAVAEAWKRNEILVLDNRENRITALRIVAGKDVKEPALEERIMGSLKEWLRFDPNYLKYVSFIESMTRLGKLPDMHYVLSDNNSVEAIAVCASGDENQLRLMEIAPWNKRTLWEKRRFTGVGHQLFAYVMNEMTKDGKRVNIFVPDPYLKDILREAGVGLKDRYDSEDAKKLLASQEVLIAQLSSPAVSAGAIGTKPGPPSMVGQAAPPAQARERMLERTRRAPRGIIDWRAAAYATELYGERARGFYNRFYNPETGKGVIIDLIRKRKEESDRHLRVWSCGSSYGLELLTLVWLTRQALEASNEWPKNWKLEFVGTDEVADVLDEAERRAELRKAAYREGGEWVEVPLDTEGFDIRFLILDHFQQDQRRDWETWQREEKGFDIVFMRGTVTAAGAEEWAMSLVRDDGFFFGDKFVIDGKGHMVFAPAPEPPSMKAAENTVLAAVAPSDVTVRDLRVKAVGFLKQFPNQRRLKDIIKAIEKRGGWATLSEIAQNLGIKTTGAVTTSDVFGVEAVEKGMPYLDELFRNINIIQVSKGRPQIEKPVAKKTKDAVTAFIAALKTLGGRASGEEMQSALGISGTAVSHYKKLIDFGRLNYNRRLADAFPLSQIMDSRMKITQDKILRALELVGGISTVSELTMLTGMKGPDVTRALKGIDFAQINAYRRTMHLFELEVRGKDTSNERYEAGMTKEAYRSIARRRKDYRRRFGIKYVSRSFERAASMIFARAFWPMVKRVPSGRDIYIESHLNFSDALDAIIDAAYRNRIYAERMKPDGRRTCSMALAEFFAIIVPRVLNNTAVMVSLRRGDIATFESALEDAWKRYKYVEANPGKEKPDGFDKTAFMFNKSIYPKDADEAIRIVRMRYRGTAPAAAEAQPQPPSEFGRVPDVMMFALGAALVSALIFTPVLLSCLGTVDMRFVMGALGAGFAAIAGIVLSLTTEGTGEYTPRPYLLKAARWAKRIEVEDRHLKIADEILKKFEADPKKRFLFGNEFGNAWTTPDKYAVILALERLAHRKPEELRKRVGTAVKVATPQGRLDHLSRIIIEHILAYLRKHKWRMPEKPKNLRDFNAFPSAERLMKEMGLTISAWGKYAKKEKIFGHLKRHYLLSRLSEHQQELVRQIVAWRRELGDLLGEKRSAGRDPDKMLGYLEEKGMVVLNADSDLVDDISGLLKDLELQEKRDIGTFCAFLANIPPLPERYVEALTARARKTSEGVSVLEKTAAQPPSMKAAESALNMRALALQDALSHEIAKSPAVEMRAGSNIIPCILSTDGENLIIGGRSINIAPSAQGIAENQELKALLREPIHILVPPGTFGRMVVSVVFENNEPVFLVEEIQPSVGYRDLVSDRKNIRKYARWVSVLVDRVYDIAAKVGINKVYVISPEKAARNVALDNDSGVPVSQAQLDHCYRAPFKNRWEIRQISYIKPLRDSVMAVNSSVWARKPAEPPSMKAAEEESRVSPNRTSAKTNRVYDIAAKVGINKVYVISPEKAARNVALDNDSGVPVSQAQLDHCYRAPFKNRWEIRQISYIKPLRDSVMAVNSSVWARKPAEPPSMKAAEEESRVSPNRTSAKTKTLDKLTDETALDSFKVLLLKALKFFHPELTEKTLNLEAIGRMLSSVSDKENYILAVKAGKVVGYCHYILITNRNGLPYGLGDNLYVDPSERGAGIGSMLSRERFKALKEKGVGIFSSVVSANDESQEFHKDFIARNRSAVMDIEYEKKTLTGYRVDIERYFNVGDTRQEPSMKAEGSGQEERPGYQDIGVSGRGDQGIGVSGKEKSQPPSMKAAESREHIKKASVETPAFHPPHPGFNPGIPDNLDAWSKIARDVNALSAAGSAPASSKPVAEPYSEPSSMVAATSGTGPILNLKASLKDMHNKVIYPYLQSNPLPEGSKIFVSSDLLDPDDVTGLNSVSNHLEVLSPEQIIREATRNNGKVSKEKIAVIVSREEFNKWTEAQKTNNKASVIVLDSDLKGSNYTYLELLIAFTRAVMANEPNNINLFAKILFGESIPDNILNHLKDSNPIGFAIKAILKFKPAIPIDPKEIIDDYKKMVNGYLVMA